jgi:hypothetical protein
MTTDFPTAPLAPGHEGAGGGAVEKSFSASHTKILTLPSSRATYGASGMMRSPSTLSRSVRLAH